MSTVWIVSNNEISRQVMKKITEAKPGEVIFLTNDEYDSYFTDCHKVERDEPQFIIDKIQEPQIIYPSHYKSSEFAEWQPLPGAWGIPQYTLRDHIATTLIQNLQYKGRSIYALKFYNGRLWSTEKGWRHESDSKPV